ncbi:hypothetical protein ACFY9N_11980 [Microbacterium sp. NPDC008134]|jgi:hypothetical protein|uniref:hypothetical protein n=1 Tax=Microbacterium sp. NPDC008134 TaxID=3364183 RepID=UPI0036E1D124
MTYDEIQQHLDGLEEFDLSLGNVTVQVRRDSPESWLVARDGRTIGSFVRHQQGRATYYESQIASEPGETNWVSDDVTTLASRMVTLES